MKQKTTPIWVPVLSFVLLLWLTACAVKPPLSPTPTTSLTPTASPTTAPSTTATPTPTFTPTLTQTPTPTATRTPTPTLTPTATVYGGYKSNHLVAWKAANRYLKISRPDGSRAVDIPQATGKKLLGWTPDGQWVLFTDACIGACANNLWAARPDGSDTRLIFTRRARMSNDEYISWHPDGNRFLTACRSAPDATTGKTQSMLCQGSLKTLTITQTDQPGGDPKYSPDGKWMAWTEVISLSPSRFGLYIQDSERVQPVRQVEFTAYTGEYLWTPDSKSIVFAHRDRFQCVFSQVILGEAEPRSLLKLDNCFPALHFMDGLSPDGIYLVYYYQSRAYILELANPSAPVLARAPLGARLVWTPDGNLLALTPGALAIAIDPRSGSSSEIQEETPWLSISRWAPASFNFYFEIFLQP